MNILHIAAISFNKSWGLTYAIPPLVSAQNKIENIHSALLITSSIVDIELNSFDFPIYEYKRKYCF